MKNNDNSNFNGYEAKGNGRLPHQDLIAFQVCKELLLAIKAADIRDTKLRDEAIEAAKAACINCYEGAGAASWGNKRRAYSIARGEASEAAGCVDIAAALDSIRPGAEIEIFRIAARAIALLTKLSRH